jgi:hypothetical protein
MRMNCLIIVLIVIVGTCTASPAYGYTSVSNPVKIRLAGKPATLQVVLVKGARIVDEAPSAMCSRRTEGSFAVRVKFDEGETVYTPLNKLMGFKKSNLQKLVFCTRPWKIVTADYNKDGQVDFNLGQYGTSNGWVYWLFTVSLSGHVSILPVPDDCIFLADDKNSTDRIRIDDQGIKTVGYANTCDKAEDCGWWETTFRWSSELNRFEEYDAKHLPEYSPGGMSGN